MRSVGTWTGGSLCAAALGSWLVWLGWRIGTLDSAIGAGVLALELTAFAGALVVTIGLLVAPRDRSSFALRPGRPTPLPILMADALRLDRSLTAVSESERVGRDDTGEIAWARRGIDVLGGRNADADGPRRSAGLIAREAAWSVVTVDGLRRMLAVVALVVVLFTGRAPFDRPPAAVVIALAGALMGLAVGHWLLSGGRIRPGARCVWSMASVGAGLGDGVSRSGLPIRWVTTMATMVSLNLAVALRGLSDRWTHGLGPMRHDARVVAMSVAFSLVLAGLVGLRTMERPDLGFYGATRRLEEDSARRLALGGTIAVALLGFFLGVLPTDGASG